MKPAFDDSGHSEGDSRCQLSDRSFQSAGALEVPIPELRDRRIFAVVANPRVDRPALTGFSPLIMPCSGALRGLCLASSVC
jgi:hypothetical protein